MTGTERSIRLAANTFAFTPAEFSRLEVALLHGAVKPNSEAHYPVGFFPEAVTVLEAAQRYSTPQELAGFCSLALNAARTLRKQGEHLRALEVDTAILGRADVFGKPEWDTVKGSATASWRLCVAEGLSVWKVTALMGQALRSHAPVDFNALVDTGLAVVESEKAAPRSAPALA